MVAWRRGSALLKRFTIFRLRILLVALLAGIATTYLTGWYVLAQSYRSTVPLFNLRDHARSVMTDGASGESWFVDSWSARNHSVSATSWYDAEYALDAGGSFSRFRSNWNHLPLQMKEYVRKEVAQSDRNRMYFAVLVGWPYQSLTGSYSSVDSMYDSEQFHYSVALRRDPTAKYRFILPLKPVMPGFAANAIVFAIFYYLTIVLAGRLRFTLIRRRRCRRACCIACGYMVLDLSICPECGQEAIGSTTPCKDR